MVALLLRYRLRDQAGLTCKDVAIQIEGWDMVTWRAEEAGCELKLQKNTGTAHCRDPSQDNFLPLNNHKHGTASEEPLRLIRPHAKASSRLAENGSHLSLRGSMETQASHHHRNRDAKSSRTGDLPSKPLTPETCTAISSSLHLGGTEKSRHGVRASLERAKSPGMAPTRKCFCASPVQI